METSSVIILDSDSDDGVVAVTDLIEQKRKQKSVGITKPSAVVIENGKSVIMSLSGTQDPQPVVRKRIKPITIAPTTDFNLPVCVQENFAPITFSEDWEKDMKQYQKQLAVQSSSKRAPGTPTSSRSSTTNDELEPTGRNIPKTKSSSLGKSLQIVVQSKKEAHLTGKNPIGKEFQQLLDACRKADPSKEMETLIEKKLIRYYEVVHPDYVNSRSFKKAVTQVTADVLSNPTLVFLKLSSIVEELNIRRKSRPSPPSQPTTIDEDKGSRERDSPSSGTTKKDRQIAKLNKTLYCLSKRIKQLDQAEVDFNHETNSTYLMTERYKKRAYEVYEKLCDITGESKNAHRLLRKPIKFEGTGYHEYNRTLQMFVNQMKTFPDFRDVLKCLEHCNARYGYGLRTEQMKQIAEDAFHRIGRQLQKRRKTDLYETATYHTGEEKDPALIDPKLRIKLEENGKLNSKVNHVIDKFAIDGDHLPGLDFKINKSTDSQTTNPVGGDTASQNSELKPSSSHRDMILPSTSSLPTTGHSSRGTDDSNSNEAMDPSTDTDDEEEDGDDDEDEDEFESTTKENVRPDDFEDIVISDDEELLVPES